MEFLQLFLSHTAVLKLGNCALDVDQYFEEELLPLISLKHVFADLTFRIYSRSFEGPGAICVGRALRVATVEIIDPGLGSRQEVAPHVRPLVDKSDEYLQQK